MISTACREDDKDNYKSIIKFRDKKDYYTFRCEEEEEHDMEEYNDNCAKKDKCAKICSNCRGNNDSLIYPFHECSEYIYTWLTKQEHVKEESITDWLLYEISQRCDFIHYQAFSRHEEAQNGSDWEWWILTKDKSKRHNFYAYRFLVQAKKLLPNERDNYSLINYGNKYGTQVDLLLDFANVKNALPLYMFYSAGELDVLEQIKNVQYIPSIAFKRCKNCINGCYISLANAVYDILYNKPRVKVLDSDLLNISFKMSILDLIFKKSYKEIDYIMNLFNSRLLIDNIISGRKYNNLDVHGIQHNENSIPQYLKVFIQNKDKNLNWFQNEMRIEDISGLGVIDLRYREGYDKVKF